jgi:glutathione synthase/RimK-type ligase-like ATP-grasp enzyme
MLAPLAQAFTEIDVAVEPVVYFDDALEAVQTQLLGLDGVLVWVNPVQDGVNRSQLDALLHEVAGRGVWVSAHPEVIRRMGTKEVLFSTQSLGWGADTEVYRSMPEFIQRFPARLARRRVLVLKQGRGTGGAGVWKVELTDPRSGQLDGDPGLDTLVRVHARGDKGQRHR